MRPEPWLGPTNAWFLLAWLDETRPKTPTHCHLPRTVLVSLPHAERCIRWLFTNAITVKIKGGTEGGKSNTALFGSVRCFWRVPVVVVGPYAAVDLRFFPLRAQRPAVVIARCRGQDGQGEGQEMKRAMRRARSGNSARLPKLPAPGSEVLAWVVNISVTSWFVGLALTLGPTCT